MALCPAAKIEIETCASVSPGLETGKKPGTSGENYIRKTVYIAATRLCCKPISADEGEFPTPRVLKLISASRILRHSRAGIVVDKP
jgi:hypothetical protein